MQTDVVLLEYLRDLHFTGKRKSIDLLGDVFSIGNLKVHPHSDTLPPARLCLLLQKSDLLIVSLLMRL